VHFTSLQEDLSNNEVLLIGEILFDLKREQTHVFSNKEKLYGTMDNLCTDAGLIYLSSDKRLDKGIYLFKYATDGTLEWECNSYNGYNVTYGLWYMNIPVTIKDKYMMVHSRILSVDD
jgi:hypothetical protein